MINICQNTEPRTTITTEHKNIRARILDYVQEVNWIWRHALRSKLDAGSISLRPSQNEVR